MQPTTFYVILYDYAYEYDHDIEVKGVFTNLDDARIALAEYAEEERAFAEENDWTIDTDDEDEIYTYREGDAASYYSRLAIKQWTKPEGKET